MDNLYPAPGELCYLAQNCRCGNGGDKRNFFFIAKYASYPDCQCVTCGKRYAGQLVHWPFKDGEGYECVVPLSWLRRVPPLSELEGVEDRVPVMVLV